MDSWAPIPTPHKLAPIRRPTMEVLRNAKGAKNADIKIAIMSDFTPILSNKDPKTNAESASTIIANEYTKGIHCGVNDEL